MKNNITSASFEEKLEQIEALLAKLNDDKITLKESIELFKQGSIIARDASILLENAKLDIQNFKQELQNGFNESPSKQDSLF